MYINEADTWNRRPLYLEVLGFLNENGLAGATVLRTVAGITGHSQVMTATFVDIGARLPLVIEFIDTNEKIEKILPQLVKMANHRLIIREEVEVITTNYGEIESHN